MNAITPNIEAAVKAGARLMVMPVMAGKWIFKAKVTYANGDGLIGNISTSVAGALDNLEGQLKAERPEEKV